MLTYFEIVGSPLEEHRSSGWKRQRFNSREAAVKQLTEWKQPVLFSITELLRTEVTRKSAKGNIVIETVTGSLENVPRILTTKALTPTYQLDGPGGIARFSTRADAEAELTKRQAKCELLSKLTEAAITEVEVLALADIMERDGEEIEKFQEAVTQANERLDSEKKKARDAVASQIEALKKQIADLETQAHHPDVIDAQEDADAAMSNLQEAIHWDELEEQVIEHMRDAHNDRCYYGECEYRTGWERECEYDPKEHETFQDMLDYLLENIEDFEDVEVGDATPVEEGRE